MQDTGSIPSIINKGWKQTQDVDQVKPHRSLGQYKPLGITEYSECVLGRCMCILPNDLHNLFWDSYQKEMETWLSRELYTALYSSFTED